MKAFFSARSSTKSLHYQMKLNVQCVNLVSSRYMYVAAMSWYHGNVSPNRPVLAICYEVGKIQLMRNENDDCEFADFFNTETVTE